MYLRAARLAGIPEDLERAIKTFDHASVPLRRLPGCAAVALMADRTAGEGMAFSYWESETAMKASEDTAADARAVITAEHNIDVIDVERYEVALLERQQPLKEGSYARLISSRGDPDRMDQLGRGMRERTLPIVRRQKGYRSILGAINRRNGRVLAGSCWETAADRDASDPGLASMRLEVMQAVGASSAMKIETFEVVFADIRVAAGTA
jgi:heme-degrading monooxygenase HmoA